MARYIMEEMPDIQKTGKRITYPKFARIDNASIKELARRVGDVSRPGPLLRRSRGAAGGTATARGARRRST